ncbi:MAG: FAD-dependent oxidoreductase [Vicinamibacterales bacterium]
MHRRHVLTTGSAAVIGFGLAGCRPSAPPRLAPAAAPRPPRHLATPRIGLDRVIRTTVGLRPHRDGGFVLRADRLDDKVVVHNYGHGGAGMSLAWGCGVLVADLARSADTGRIAVLGCGAPGLCTAIQLQRRGYDVTIYAATVPPDTTSNRSWAGFTPTTALIAPERRTPAWDAQFRTAAEISYQQLQTMVGPRYGVYWIDAYNATDAPEGGGGSERERDLVPDVLRPNRDREVLGPGEHPFPTPYAIRTSNLAIEPSIYMQALVDDFRAAGGRIVIRRFEGRRDLMALSERVVVNCTGLGSFSLFDDKELVPIKGQLTFMIPQPELDYRVSSRAANGGNAGLNPRRDGIVVGNSQEPGVWSLDVNQETLARNVEAAMAFVAGMRAPAPGTRLTRSTPPTSPPAAAAFYDWSQ